MPSFISKLTNKKKNPYIKAQHPSHNPPPKPPSTNTHASTAPHPQAQLTLPPRPASPRDSYDFLAEARQLAGRDPVTGRRRPDTNGRFASERTFVSEERPMDVMTQVDREERTAYQSTAANKQATGQRYNLFVQEMVAKRDEENRVRAARGGVEYYAPERKLGEFYAEGVRD